MKEDIRLFKIGDLSALFHVGVDSIRYYEKVGLLHPIRSEKNNYRLYTIDDVRVMNTIRELLDLGFQTNEILEFEKDRTLDHMIDMLSKEETAIDEQIKSLRQKKESISARLRFIHDSLALDCSQNVIEKDFPVRPCMKIVEGTMADEMINYKLAQFNKTDQDQTSTIGVCDCYELDIEHINEEGNDYRTRSVFFYAPELPLKCNFSLPAGHYLTLCYRGGFRKSLHLVPKMLNYAKEHHYQLISHPMEFCHIDRYETDNVEEYLIELQIQVEKS
jgi:DNA-binding transcriptional MerR regulator